MANISDADRAKFAGAVARIWANQAKGKPTAADTDPVLKNFGVVLPEGVPTPNVPERPDGDLGTAWWGLTFEHWDVKIEELPSDSASLSVSSLACAACPVSCFSSLSN